MEEWCEEATLDCERRLEGEGVLDLLAAAAAPPPLCGGRDDGRLRDRPPRTTLRLDSRSADSDELDVEVEEAVEVYNNTPPTSADTER